IMTPPPRLRSSEEPDPVLAELVERLADRLNAGEAVDIEAWLAQHSGHAEQLRPLLPLVLGLADLGQSGERVGGDVLPADQGALRVLGDYRIHRQIGRGGVGVVYEAQQLSLGRHVALKVLPPRETLHPTQRERFRREARAAARLHHTNIVPVFGVGEHDGVHFYAMQFIDGQSLDEVLRELRRLRQEDQAEPSTRVEAKPSVELARGVLTGAFIPAQDGEVPSSTAAVAGASTHSGLATRTEAEHSRSVARIGVQAAQGLEY